MPRYQAPPGYWLDSGSGLYYREAQMTTPDGQPVRHIYWFNAETGDYVQRNILLNPAGALATQRAGQPKPQGAKRRGLLVLAALGVAVLLVLGAGFVVRRLNAPEIITVTPEQAAAAAGLGEPAADPVFEPYEGSLQPVTGEEGNP